MSASDVIALLSPQARGELLVALMVRDLNQRSGIAKEGAPTGSRRKGGN